MKKLLLSDIVQILPSSRRKKGVGVIALLFFGSVLDFFSLAFFLPLIFLLINPDEVKRYPFVSRIFELLGIDSMTTFSLMATGLVFLFLIAKTLIIQWITRQKATYAYEVYGDLASQAAQRYLNLSHLEFTKAKLSEEVNLISYLPLIIANNIIIPAGTFISEAIVFCFLLAGVAMFDFPVFALLFMILSPAYLLYRLRKKRLRTVSGAIKSDYPLMVRYSLLIVEGLGDIRAFNKESYFRKKFDEASRRLSKVFSWDHAVHASTPRFTELIAGACIFVLIIYGLVTQQDQQELVLLLALYAGVAFRIIPGVNRMLATLQQMRVHEYSVAEFIEIQKSRTEFSAVETSPVRFDQRISLEDVSFHYPGQKNILDQINLEIRKGERVALIGKSGSGKTSILLLLLRLIKEQKGNVYVDEVKLTLENSSSWRSQIGYVPQHPYMIDGSIAENIAFTLDAGEIDYTMVNELITALDLQPWISTLREGVGTRIGEKGATVSGGQRQRIAIARALYHNPEVLLFDEVTNQLDRETEKEVIDLLFRVAERKRTLVMITHYPDLLDRFDSVYELTDGYLTPIRKIAMSETR